MKPYQLTIAFLLLLVGFSSFFLDAPTREWINSNQDSQTKKLMGWISDYGDWPELMGLGVFLLAVGFLCKQSGMKRLIITMIVASTLSGLAVNSLRLTTGRTRPRNTEVAQGFYGPFYRGEWLIGRNKFNSFPSGHVATATGFVLPIVFATGPAGLPLLAIPMTMAFSRMYLGAHHFSDVIFSLGISFGVSWWVIRSRRSRSYGSSPSVDLKV
jgi:membrane-associated phospholipid phosphatase